MTKNDLEQEVKFCIAGRQAHVHGGNLTRNGVLNHSEAMVTAQTLFSGQQGFMTGGFHV